MVPAGRGEIMTGMSGESAPDPRTIQDFEDFRLGQRFAGGERTVTAAELAAFTAVSGDRHPLHTDPSYARAQGFDQVLVHGPYGLAGFFGWFFELGIASDTVVALLDTNWRYVAQIYAGDTLHYEMTITRCQRTSAGNRGIVGRHVRVRNQRGTIVQEGSTAVLVRARGDERVPAQELFTPAWAVRIAQRLGSDEAFRSATATWDGTIALAGDREETQFRIYRGKVLEAGGRAPNGPTFTVVASDLTWAELVSGATNDTMRRAMQGAFSVRGAAYEYLRLTRAIALLVDAARAEFQEATRS
jgi:acyl dehydratase